MAKIVISTECPFCGKHRDVEVDKEHYELWRYKRLNIQEAIPELSASDREALISGICGVCWDMMLG